MLGFIRPSNRSESSASCKISVPSAPTPTLNQAFAIATKNSFDYSSFVFAGVTSVLAEATDAHRSSGRVSTDQGMGLVGKTVGNYPGHLCIAFSISSRGALLRDRQESFWKRPFYSASRVAVTPDYHGHNGFNISELLGRVIAQEI
jgi:hypothetical protein